MTLDKKEIRRAVDRALLEDRAGMDVTTRLLIDPRQTAEVAVTARSAGVLCGAELAQAVFKRLDPRASVRLLLRDGARLSPGRQVMTVRGRAARLLSAERAALNFLQHLSGVATLSDLFARAARGTRAKILDTRKTVPGLRALQKYAVRCGGAQNHRMALSDMALVKDNHLLLLGRDRARLKDLKRKLPKRTLLEIEAKSLSEARLAAEAGADIVMLDNMSLPRLRQAVRFLRGLPRPPAIEVSGGVRLKNVRAIARLGVDRISVGALTHSAPALDLSLDVL